MIIDRNAAWAIEGNARPVARDDAASGMLDPHQKVCARRDPDIRRSNQPAVEHLTSIPAGQLQEVGLCADNHRHQIIGPSGLVQPKGDRSITVVGQRSGVRGRLKEIS
jgi:hypothetical protein